MILIPGNSRGSYRKESTVVRHIVDEIEALCGDSLSLSDLETRELARAVELYLDEYESVECVDAGYLVMLASQALKSIGQENAGRRLYIFGSGMVKPAEWVITGEHQLWILDLKQITLGDRAPLELLFFNSLVMILDAMADVWDDSAGSGGLGLRHVCRSIEGLLDIGRRSRRARMLSDEIIDICRIKLDKLKSERGWERAPDVINLDQ